MYTKTEPFFNGMNNIYAKSLNAFLNHKWWSIPIVVIPFGSIGYFWRTIRPRTFSTGRPFIHFDQYTCTGRSYLPSSSATLRDQVAAMAEARWLPSGKP
ncbi:MAG: hypothetical protein ACLR6J_08835 [Parabacteroides merdae]